MFQEKNYHFKENDNKPNIEQILKTLNENGVLELNFNLPERRSNTENIIQQLRKYNFDLLEDEYLDRPIDFIFQLTNNELLNKDSVLLEVSINNLISNGIQEENKNIKNIFIYKTLLDTINDTISKTIYKSIHLQGANIEIQKNKDILDIYKKLYDFSRKIERLNEFFKTDFNHYYERYLKYEGINDEEFNKVEKSKDLFEKLGTIQEILGKKDRNVRNGGTYNPRIFERNLYRILNTKDEYNNEIFNFKLKDEFTSIKDDINRSLEKINDEEIQNEINLLLNSKKQTFTLYLSEFIPAFISRIDIIEEGEKKKTFIDKFESRKKSKDRLSSGYLFLSMIIFAFIIFLNYSIYLDNYSNNKTLSDFIESFLGHNIYLFSIEVLLLIIAFYFLGLFKTYSKIVELYDSHILLIESDFYYKDDKDLGNLGNDTFEMRKENTQKIHSLPEKTFEMLNGKLEIKTESPTGKVLDKIGEILEKILLGLKK